MPVLTILTGPSGAGKSTLAARLEPEKGQRFQEIDKQQNKPREARYGDLVEQARLCIQKGNDFGIDLVFGGREIEDLLLPAKRAGYRIEVHIVGVETPDACVHRVRQREAEGGHGHPPEAVYALHVDALAAAGEIAILADDCRVYDNSTDTLQETAHVRNFETTLRPGPTPGWAEPILQAGR